jgi:hypothetical protein
VHILDQCNLQGSRLERDDICFNKAISASRSAPAGTTPVEGGASIKIGSENALKDEYETAPGIVIAYRLHVARPYRAGAIEKMVRIEVDGEELNTDLDIEAKFTTESIGDEVYILSE